MDVFWDGSPLTWQYIESESPNDLQLRSWPSGIGSQFPMKGINFFDGSMKNVGEINILRTSLVFMVRINDSTNNGFDLDEWQFTKHEGPYLGWSDETAKVYSRLMLPGKYQLYDQAFYLFASSGNENES